MKKRILTGDRPTGPLHIGHYLGSLANRVKLQSEYDCFFIIADYQVLTDHLYETEKTRLYVKDVLLDWLSVGLDPDKSTFFIQSRVPEIAELTMYFSMLVSLARVQRNPTVKEEFKAARLSAMSYGFLGYPISQAADILSVRSNLVPVGEDNLPHVEQAREIARAFNQTFSHVFAVPEGLVGEVPRLPGLDGQKMGKSTGNAIYLSDKPEEVQRKVGAAVTDPARMRATDPGHPEVCNVYRYHAPFGTAAEAQDVEERCRQAAIGCVACKKKAADKLNSFLEPLRLRRAYFEERPSIINEAICDGIQRTRTEAAKTMELVREAMHYDYKDLLGGDPIAAR